MYEYKKYKYNFLVYGIFCSCGTNADQKGLGETETINNQIEAEENTKFVDTYVLNTNLNIEGKKKLNQSLKEIDGKNISDNIFKKTFESKNIDYIKELLLTEKGKLKEGIENEKNILLINLLLDNVLGKKNENKNPNLYGSPRRHYTDLLKILIENLKIDTKNIKELEKIIERTIEGNWHNGALIVLEKYKLLYQNDKNDLSEKSITTIIAQNTVSNSNLFGEGYEKHWNDVLTQLINGAERPFLKKSKKIHKSFIEMLKQGSWDKKLINFLIQILLENGDLDPEIKKLYLEALPKIIEKYPKENNFMHFYNPILNTLKESAITAEILSAMANHGDDQIQNILKVISSSKDLKKLFEVFNKKNFYKSNLLTYANFLSFVLYEIKKEKSMEDILELLSGKNKKGEKITEGKITDQDFDTLKRDAAQDLIEKQTTVLHSNKGALKLLNCY